MKKEYHILNLGAGVQSTTLALLGNEGKLLNAEGQVIRFDAAVFADTQDEPEDPGHSVYDHLTWLQSVLSYPIKLVTIGKLSEHLSKGLNGSGGRFAAIPAFTWSGKKVGRTRRQCTREYKIRPIGQAIRRQVMGLRPKQRIPKGVLVHQYIGISIDEAGRMLRMKKRLEELPEYGSVFHWPLIEQFGWTRGQCRAYLEPIVPHRVPRSACVFCPFHDNEEWKNLKERNGPDWAKAVAVDKQLRAEGVVVNRNMNAQMFLHPACKPLEEIDFNNATGGERRMAGECTGMCGQ